MRDEADDKDGVARAFEEHRPRLRAIAYRMLGSTSEADDAVQETWLRLHRQDLQDIEDLDAWLTTVIARIALNLLRARRTRREEPLDFRMPDPVVSPIDGGDPEQEALVADAVGLALAVVLDTLRPAERLAFVLHDMFGIAFDDIGAIVERTPEAARQLASRARARIRDADQDSDPDPATQREVVEAYFTAAREGDFEQLLSVLDPDIVLRRDAGSHGPSEVIRGARNVAKRALAFASGPLDIEVVLVDGAPGLAARRDGRPASVGAALVRNGRIVRLDFLLDPERLAAVDLGFLDHG